MSFGRLSSTSSRRNRARTVAALSVPVALSLLLAACGGDKDEAADPTDEPTDTTKTQGLLTLNGEWPLTGETLEGDLPEHPVYVVKIDNTSSSAPQIGLDKADMVVEELVEGGLTRLAVFYYSEIPDDVGPVRSMRASDIGIVKPVSANLVASGAAPVTVNRLAGADVPTFTEGTTGFYRNSGRSAPYNLFMNLADLADKPGADWTAPTAAYLPFGDEGDFKGSIPVSSIAAQFSGGHTTTWELEGGAWTRPDSYAEAGKDFTADNILLLRVKVGDAGYLDPAGNPVPETDFFGTGEGVLVHGDKAMKVTWTKKDKGSDVSLTNKAGDEVTVPAGHTWIELVPTDTGNVTLSK